MIDHFSSISMYSTDLCNELGKLADVDLLTVNDSSLNGEQNYRYKKILFGHHDGSKLVSVIKYLLSLALCFGKIICGKYDIIHIQSFRNIRIESWLFKLTKRKNVKYVHTLHNILPHEASAKDKTDYGRVYEICDALIAHNRASKETFTQVFPNLASKITIIPHGAYTYIKDMVHPKKKTSKTIFFQLGLIRQYKGIDILLAGALKLSDEDKKKCHVIIAGRQDRRMDPTDYEGFIKANHLGNIVTFIPQKISDNKMAELYNITDVCVFPYRNIYGSGSLLMAYTFEKPVLVSNIPTFCEETENGLTGLLFENGNADDLAIKMHEYINMSEKDMTMLKENIVYMREEKYNWRICAEKTMLVYKGENHDIC